MGERAEQLVGAVELGDVRLERRVVEVVETFLTRPEATIPTANSAWAATQATYRLLANDAVRVEALVEGMGQATVQRCPSGEVLLAVQDTTSVDYTHHRGAAQLGPLEDPTHRGILLHTTLAVTAAGQPMGVVDQQVWERDPEQTGHRHQRHALPIEGKESVKWLHAMHATIQRVGTRCPLVTVADREADIFDLFALAAELPGDWVIRARHDRVLAAEPGVAEPAHLLTTLAAAPCLLQTTVAVSRQANRAAREAQVEVRVAEVALPPPAHAVQAHARWWAAHPEVAPVGPRTRAALTVGVVLVSEPHPPSGERALHWLLVTSLPLTTVDEALTCVHYYRLRWLVERFHYVLKSGCHVEQLQLETAARLERALVIYSAVAAWMLHATYQARVAPEAPATVIMEDDAWRVLLTVHYPHRSLPPQPPTVREALRLVAQLGGFLARNGDGEPGVKTVWRGFTRLTDMLIAWRIFTSVSTPSPP